MSNLWPPALDPSVRLQHEHHCFKLITPEALKLLLSLVLMDACWPGRRNVPPVLQARTGHSGSVWSRCGTSTHSRSRRCGSYGSPEGPGWWWSWTPWRWCSGCLHPSLSEGRARLWRFWRTLIICIFTTRLQSFFDQPTKIWNFKLHFATFVSLAVTLWMIRWNPT